jgi:hypothetical protein
MSPVIYKGTRTPDGSPVVTKQVDDRPPEALNLRLDLRRHAGEANWGYSGSGPRQLATALLADVVGDGLAMEAAAKFKDEVLANLPREGFELTAEAIEAWARAWEDRHPPRLSEYDFGDPVG